MEKKANGHGISMGASYWKKVDLWGEQAGMTRSGVIRLLIETHAHDRVISDGIFASFAPREDITYATRE